MTSQSKHFIETSDIVALRFECGCGSIVLTPIASFQTMPVTCSNCGAEFAELYTRNVQEAFAQVISALKRAQTVADHKKFKFALEIKAMASTPQKSEPESK